MEKHYLAIEYAEKALKANDKNGFAYVTLAETYAFMGNDEVFYKNIEQVLKCNFPVWEYLDEITFEKYHKQTRFSNLIKKYRKK